ncbi:MAG: hypothetical protein MR399_03010, partial [Clostridiales bacterium]|nr:hypothetical protein [Clostridiales bacterium]
SRNDLFSKMMVPLFMVISLSLQYERHRAFRPMPSLYRIARQMSTRIFRKRRKIICAGTLPAAEAYKKERRFVRPTEAPSPLSVFSYALLTTGPFAVSITA